MADKKGVSKLTTKKKVETKPDKGKEKEAAAADKEKKDDKTKKAAVKQPEKPKTPQEKPKTPQQEKPKTPQEEKPTENGEKKEGAVAMETDGEEMMPIELPPFEVIIGERMNPCYFKFQFRNVEYSSGRNKTFLCYLVDVQGKTDSIESKRGYLEDDHAVGGHAEEAFFREVLPQYDSSLTYVVTWYTSSSPCVACAAKIAEVLRARKKLRLIIYFSRIFLWEEPDIHQGLKGLEAAGCKLRMMKPNDFIYTWDTFVENEEMPFVPWEDCQENYEYYSEKLTDILR